MTKQRCGEYAILYYGFASRTHARSALWSDVCIDLLTLSTSSEKLHGLRRLMMIVTVLIVTAGYVVRSILLGSEGARVRRTDKLCRRPGPAEFMSRRRSLKPTTAPVERLSRSASCSVCLSAGGSSDKQALRHLARRRHEAGEATNAMRRENNGRSLACLVPSRLRSPSFRGGTYAI